MWNRKRARTASFWITANAKSTGPDRHNVAHGRSGQVILRHRRIGPLQPNVVQESIGERHILLLKSSVPPMQHLNNSIQHHRAELISAVETASSNRQFLGNLSRILAKAESEVKPHQDFCTACGACCRFDQVDHRLFVSTGELALMMAGTSPSKAPVLRCCYQNNQLCELRNHRPLGCRVYFCSKASGDATDDTYETYHQKIRNLHDSDNIKYLYMEQTFAVSLLVNDGDLPT